MGGRGDAEPMSVWLTVAELVLLNNALNEVLHGVNIEEAEFGTRLGAPRPKAVSLLTRLGRLVDEQGARLVAVPTRPVEDGAAEPT